MRLFSGLQWTRILLSAMLVAVVVMGLLYLGLGELLVTWACADIEPDPAARLIVRIIDFFFQCFLLGGMMLLVSFGLMSVALSAVLIALTLRQRRLIHTILTAVLSIVIGLGLFWLIETAFS